MIACLLKKALFAVTVSQLVSEADAFWRLTRRISGH